MTAGQRSEIERLAADAHDKRQQYLYLGMTNTPVDRDEAKLSAIGYALAKAELAEAERALREAVEG